MQFYQKRRENCVKTHVILKKASFYACLTLFAGMAFPMPLWASQSTAIVQQHVKQITGIVNDTSGAPVIGANVVESGKHQRYYYRCGWQIHIKCIRRG